MVHDGFLLIEANATQNTNQMQNMTYNSSDWMSNDVNVAYFKNMFEDYKENLMNVIEVNGDTFKKIILKRSKQM